MPGCKGCARKGKSNLGPEEESHGEWAKLPLQGMEAHGPTRPLIFDWAG